MILWVALIWLSGVAIGYALGDIRLQLAERRKQRR